MQHFVEEDSIVRKIWGKSDTVLFIFAGASAEFALNKAVDWLYFTGKLPSDPLGRLFSTVDYAKRILFLSKDEALLAIDTMNTIHASLEKSRGFSIPDWAYRDVLFMLIYYSIASYELLERKLDDGEKEEIYDVFYRVGSRMGLKELPLNYKAWLPVRNRHLEEDMQRSELTIDLFKQYKKHLGPIRYRILIEAQTLVVPGVVRKLLRLSEFSLLAPVVPLYKMSRLLRIDKTLKSLMFPPRYRKQMRELDTV